MSGFEIDVRVDRGSRTGRRFRLETTFRDAAGITVVYGPSGAGKTTLLLAIVGALRPAGGRIVAADRTLFDSETGVDLPICERRIGIVFQEALLFPHLNVRDNVAFGLRSVEGSARAEPWLERVGAADLAKRMPSELSGGQRQRVALARSLAAEPAALLLDEPFSALDMPARESLCQMLIELQAESRVPFLHVTHDLGEALRMGTGLVVIDGGRVVQTGPPSQVVARPSSAATARAVGTENLFTGKVEQNYADEGYTTVDLGGTRVQTALLDAPPGGRIALGLRAEDILLSLHPVRDTSARNVVAGTVERIGSRDTAIELVIATPVRFRVMVTPAAVRELGLAEGKRVNLLIKASSFHRLV